MKIHHINRTKVVFHCPGCRTNHVLNIGSGSPRWNFNGNCEEPTFSPSINYPYPPQRCHCFITDGMIRFLDDCDHNLAGKTVELPEWVDHG